jgi:hypothetical protein
MSAGHLSPTPSLSTAAPAEWVSNAAGLRCPRCGRELAGEALQPQGATCVGCEAHVEALVFPALYRREQSSAYELAMSGQAGCFFHPDRVAGTACSRCGRFLCPLCRISWAGESVCTACLEAADRGGNGRALASGRFHFDTLAVVLSTFPILTLFFSLLTAPFALGLALFTWRRECSIAPRSKIRFIAAILFSLLTLAGWIAFFGFYLVPALRRQGG